MPAQRALPARNKALLDEVVDAFSAALTSRLVAIYRYGTDFARGPRAAIARLLVLVDRIDQSLLEAVKPAALKAREHDVRVQLDTPRDVLQGADAFPIFALDLIHTRRLLTGDDALASLAVNTADLRLQLEHSLRMIHRDLLGAYLREPTDRHLAGALRTNARKAMYLLEGMLILRGVERPDPATPRRLIEAACGPVLPEASREVWERLRRFAAFEDSLEHDDLLGLLSAVLATLGEAIERVDHHEG